MPDRYAQLVTSPLGSQIASAVGLPQPEQLRRYEPGQPLLDGPVLAGGATGGDLLSPVLDVLRTAGAEVRSGLPASEPDDQRYAALVYDASGIADSSRLRELYAFLHPVIRRLLPSGRVLVLGTPPEDCTDPRERAAQRALEGFVRSVGKEVKRGATAQLLYVARGAESGVGSTVRFLLSAKSAYVSGQVVRVSATDAGVPDAPTEPEHPLAGKTALVTGAARGIGKAIAQTLARDGAHVICLDIPQQGEALSAVANEVGGSTLQLDITDEAAPQVIVDHVTERHGGVDVVVHNAGVTRDKTLAGMDDARWDMVLDINLTSQERINDALLGGALNEGGRIVCISSMSGIAGNRGQTNYAASKAGVIGLVEGTAPLLDGGRTINAIAPGFIETEMTDAMPFGVREAGRRMSSLGQGGQPVDVAEAVAWFADPGSTWVNGNVVRVCGQNLLGA
jgi:3-oxoacyl-[acyl-carrier protein] reductase